MILPDENRSAVHFCQSQRRRKALLNLSRSIRPRSPISLGMQTIGQLRRDKSCQFAFLPKWRVGRLSDGGPMWWECDVPLDLEIFLSIPGVNGYVFRWVVAHELFEGHGWAAENQDSGMGNLCMLSGKAQVRAVSLDFHTWSNGQSFCEVCD